MQFNKDSNFKLNPNKNFVTSTVSPVNNNLPVVFAKQAHMNNHFVPQNIQNRVIQRRIGSEPVQLIPNYQHVSNQPIQTVRMNNPNQENSNIPINENAYSR